MRKLNSKLLLALVALTLLFTGKTAKAEEIPVDFASVMALVQPYLQSGGGIPAIPAMPTIPGSTVNLGACQPTVTPGFPTSTINFVPTLTCPVSGNIYLNLVPMGVSVRLEILAGPVEKLQADFAVLVKRKGSTTTVNWQVVNGYVSIRAMSGLPAQSYNITGLGDKVVTKKLTTSKSRMNIFDVVTTNGSALFGESSKVKSASFATSKIALCSLYGADKTKVESGTLVNCRDLK